MGENLYITNLNSGQKAISDFTGKFQIMANAGDNLLINGFNIESRNFKIQQDFFSRDVMIHLNVKTVVLESVTVYPNKLTGNLEKDIFAKKEKLKTEVLIDEIGLPERTGDGKINSEPAMNFIFPNPYAIYDIISGKRRKREELYDFEDKQNNLIHIKDYFSDEYFINDLKIPENEILIFIDYCYVSNNLQEKIKKKDYFEIQNILKKSAELYLNRKNKF